MSKNFIVSIEGVIGAGKSSLTHELCFKNKSNWNCVNEPVKEFCSFGKHNPLLNAYSFPYSDAAIAQVHFSLVLAKNFKKNFSCSSLINIWDRSRISPEIFIKTYSDLGYFSNFVTDFLLQFSFCQMKNIPLPDLIIYLDVPLNVAMERIKQRSRGGENLCSLQLQMFLEKNYLLTLDGCSKLGVKIVKVPAWNTTISQLTDEVEKIIEKEYKIHLKTAEE